MNANENARYRNELKLQKAEPSHPKGAKSLFEHRRSEIIPEKAYYRIDPGAPDRQVHHGKYTIAKT